MEIEPDDLKRLRLQLGLSAAKAAESIHVALRTWQCYEAGINHRSFRRIPAASLELFCNKNKTPYPPTRQDGTMPTQSTKVIALLSGTGGSGKTSIALELGRTFALAGKSALVVTDAPGVTATRFAFDNPKIVSEKDVRLTNSEVRDLRQRLIDDGVINRNGQALLSGIELFIASGDLNRLNAKTCGAYSLDSLRLSADIIIMDDVVDPEVALGVCDLVIFVFDASHWAAIESTEAAFHEVITKNRNPIGLPLMRSLLTNVGHPDNGWFIHSRVKEFELPVLHTVISTAHSKDRIRAGHAYGKAEKYKLLVDGAPCSLSAFEYDSLARELMKELALSPPAPLP